MSYHGLIDEVSVRLGALFSPKYFREGADSAPIEDHLQSTRLVGALDIEQSGEQELLLDSQVGELTAAVLNEAWAGSEFPAVIYHHGASEIPYDYGFRHIFPRVDPHCRGVNLFALRAPWHGSRADFSRGSARLSRWMAMLAASVRIAEETVTLLRETGVPAIAISGTSLGGFVTNLHHIHFGSADLYFPVLAGLAMDEPYLDSVYSRSVAPLKKGEVQLIRRRLNFEEGFSSRTHDGVFPLLALHDRLLTYRRQLASYGGCPAETLNRGHVTGAVAFSAIRDHVLSRLRV